MTFDTFLTLFQNAPFINSSAFALVTANPGQLRSQVGYWQKRGYLHALRRGVYVLDERYKRADVNPLAVANHLITPSYVSLESALSYYALIPEQAQAYTSLTTRHTRSFNNLYGTFTYRTVKPSLFVGYEPRQAGEREILIATAEKALLDYFYLNSGSMEVGAPQVESLRLQNLEILDIDRLNEYARLFGRKVQRLAKVVEHAAGR